MKDFLIKLILLRFWLFEAFEGWKSEIWERDLDQRYCCDGRECACGGQLVREVYAQVYSKEKHECRTVDIKP